MSFNYLTWNKDLRASIALQQLQQQFEEWSLFCVCLSKTLSSLFSPLKGQSVQFFYRSGIIITLIQHRNVWKEVYLVVPQYLWKTGAHWPKHASQVHTERWGDCKFGSVVIHKACYFVLHWCILPTTTSSLFFIWLLFHFSGSVLSAEFLLISRLCSPCLCLFSVSLVKSKLDPESLGIILLGPFLLEFFPDQVCVCERVSGNQLSLQKIQGMTHAFHISHDPYHGENILREFCVYSSLPRSFSFLKPFDTFLS